MRALQKLQVLIDLYRFIAFNGFSSEGMSDIPGVVSIPPKGQTSSGISIKAPGVHKKLKDLEIELDDLVARYWLLLVAMSPGEKRQLSTLPRRCSQCGQLLKGFKVRWRDVAGGPR